MFAVADHWSADPERAWRGFEEGGRSVSRIARREREGRTATGSRRSHGDAWKASMSREMALEGSVGGARRGRRWLSRENF